MGEYREWEDMDLWDSGRLAEAIGNQQEVLQVLVSNMKTGGRTF